MSHCPIFISYKRADFDRVKPIKDYIESQTGVSCWMDLEGIESDAQFVEVIMSAIENCSVFLFMCSKEHHKIKNDVFFEDWTIREIRYAEECKK